MCLCVLVQLKRLQDENNSLVGKHSKRSQEMQDEAIDLPNTVEVVTSSSLVFSSVCALSSAFLCIREIQICQLRRDRSFADQE